MNKIEIFNRTLFLLVNSSDGTPSWLIHTAIGVAEGLIYFIPLLLLSFWLWGDYTRRSLALKACIVALLGVAANQVIGMLWPHPRPVPPQLKMDFQAVCIKDLPETS